MAAFNLEQHGITVEDFRRNLAPAELYTEAIREDPKCALADSGGLIAYSGEKTGRSPKDKRVVREPETEHEIWWGAVNIPIERSVFDITLERARDYLNTRKKL